jgi:Holliday junction DNA helicase RuvA
MIGFLRGRLLEKHPDRLLVDVHGVGYDVAVPLSTFYTLSDQGEDIALRVHTYVRDQQIALYGFATALEQQLFERLIGVAGVGPKIALAALSGLAPADLVRAIRSADIARLTRVPGIGRKTAERIALELKDKLPAESAAGAPAGATVPSAADARADLLSALVNLGYQRASAEGAVESASRSLGTDATFQAILRQALKELAK